MFRPRSCNRKCLRRKSLLTIGTYLFLIYLITRYESNKVDVLVQQAWMNGQRQNVHHSDATVVLLLSYQRCGSSFTGQILNHNPDAYYVFEPLDAVYVSMYGTSPGWNVPSDITHFWNGSHRALPSYEHNIVSKALTDILSCNTEDVPTEYFTHKFWNIFKTSLGKLSKTRQCLVNNKNKRNKNATCAQLTRICPKRFGGNLIKSTDCYNHLHNQTNLQESDSLAASAKAYQDCQMANRVKIVDCIKLMGDTCSKSRIHSAKTVRLTMGTVEYMLKENPDLKVVHLFRDPRPVALSRMHDRSYRSFYAHKSLIKEARLYCESVMSDIAIRQRLEQQYPSAFYEIIYDDFVVDVIPKAKKLYDFLKLPFPTTIEDWLVLNSYERRNSSHISEKWKTKLGSYQAMIIKETCKNLFDHVAGAWN